MPNDPVYASSPGPQWDLDKIHAPEAWALTTGDHSVIIAVGDTGAPVDGPPSFPTKTPHPDFKDNLWAGQNNVPNGEIHNWIDRTKDIGSWGVHGTHVASTIGARGNNSSFMTGVAWDVQLMILKLLTFSGNFRPSSDPTHYPYQAVSSDIHDGIEYASTHGATAINLSLGYAYYTNTEGFKDYETDQHVLDAIHDARSNGMLVVAAAGNNSIDIDSTSLSPAALPADNIVAVGATTKDDTAASYSNYGDRVDLSAPGGNDTDPILGLSGNFDSTPTPTPGSGGGGGGDGTGDPSPPPIDSAVTEAGASDPSGKYNFFQGTSMAAPHVSGAVALVKSRFPWEGYLGLRDRILMGVDHLTSLTGWSHTGGRLNLFKALQRRTQLLNISTRARVEGGDRVMVAGFVVGGSSDPVTGAANGGPVRVGIRGLGPSLAPRLGAGTAYLGNPVIELHAPDGSIVSNDNWQSDSSAADVIAAGLAPQNPSEAAFVRTLLPGAYTVILRDYGSQYGVGLVEVYNLDGAANERSRLLNISTRCLVGTGDNLPIAGTIVAGDSDVCDPPDRRVLMFGKGPSLACDPNKPNDPCVANPLADPQIELHMTADANGNAMDAVLGTDDQYYQSIGGALEDELSDAGRLPKNVNESALWPTLRPGTYTTVLSGKNNSQGIGLVEFYEY